MEINSPQDNEGQSTSNQMIGNPRVESSQKKNFNYWIVSTGVFVLLSFALIVIYNPGISPFPTRAPTLTPFSPTNTVTPPKPVKKRVKFKGTIMTGTQIGKEYCPEGLYLIAQEGTALVDQTTMLLLKTENKSSGKEMLSGQKYVGKEVEVSGLYPAQELFCEALICECEDYILVEQINIPNPQPAVNRQTE